MTTSEPRVFFGRPDTILGVCEAIARDFGFNPNWLRIGLGIVVVFNIAIAFAVYLSLGVIVMISRILVPVREVVTTTAVQTPVADKVHADNDVELAPLAMAA